MAVNLSMLAGAGAQFFDNSGVPLTGGLVYTYAAGTTTPQATYTTSSGGTAHANPIVLDSAGRIPSGGEIWLTDAISYKFVLKTATAVTIATYDNVTGNSSGIYAAFAASSGSSLVGYTQGGTGAVATTVQAKLREFVSLKDFGAVGNGTTDDTAAVVLAINFINSNACVLMGDNLNYVVQYGVLPSVTKANSVLANINFTGKAGTTGTFLTIAGNYCTLRDVTVNGNMANMTSNTQGGDLLHLTGNNTTLDNVNLLAGTSVGLGIYDSVYVNASNCNFSNNASLGIQTYGASYLNFVNCQANANGYGYKNTRPYPINQTSANSIGFGVGIRCTSHHVTFTNCQFNDNGRDGITVGQGSYEAKFTACQALRNGDGGFTANKDNTGTGRPGEGLSPYDLWYDNCESANNYTSGISLYCSVYGVQVIGGSYYNNHRVAGDQTTEASSYFNGIYAAAASEDVVIRGARAYDNRNLTSVPTGQTATGSGPYTLTVNAWTIGTMNYYPKIAFYNTNGAFQGYAQLTAETTTSVTFNLTTYNAVTPGSIGGGWLVTQRVQHNGVFLDNSCNGSIDAVCSGHMQGPSSVVNFTGYDMISGGYANGQNVNLARNVVDATELLLNPTFDSNVTSWTANTTGGGSFGFDTTIARSPGSGKLVGGTSVAYADATLATSANSYVTQGWVRFSAWVYTSAFNGAFITLFWNGTSQTTAVSSLGESAWELLEITAFIPPGNASISARINVGAGITAYFDNLSLRGIAPPRGGDNLGVTWNGKPY